MSEIRLVIVKETARYVRHELYDESSGHDWWHVERVRRLALAIGAREGADLYVVELAALLHDVSDYKLNGGDPDKGSRMAQEVLLGLGESVRCAGTVADIIHHVSFKGAGEHSAPPTTEGRVIQDADRLDAIGAIGIARAFAYGGFAGQVMHDPGVEPEFHEGQEEYRARNGTTINHFYEKLLLLKDRMNTDTGRQIARRRHRVVERFLHEFFYEWGAEDVSAD